MSDRHENRMSQESADLAMDIRNSIRGELEAINDYVEFARRTPTAEAAALFEHVANDERHHAVEFFALLMQVDPAQCQAYMDVFSQGMYRQA